MLVSAAEAGEGVVVLMNIREAIVDHAEEVFLDLAGGVNVAVIVKTLGSEVRNVEPCETSPVVLVVTRVVVCY